MRRPPGPKRAWAARGHVTSSTRRVFSLALWLQGGGDWMILMIKQSPHGISKQEEYGGTPRGLATEIPRREGRTTSSGLAVKVRIDRQGDY